jgi:hypothetical protein
VSRKGPLANGYDLFSQRGHEKQLPRVVGEHVGDAGFSASHSPGVVIAGELGSYCLLLGSALDSSELGSTWGAGSDFGVTPSISFLPSGHTMCRSNTMRTPNLPSSYSPAIFVGNTFASKDANALVLVTASIFR